jgi:hypothetical protein
MTGVPGQIDACPGTAFGGIWIGRSFTHHPLFSCWGLFLGPDDPRRDPARRKVATGSWQRRLPSAMRALISLRTREVGNGLSAPK